MEPCKWGRSLVAQELVQIRIIFLTAKTTTPYN